MPTLLNQLLLKSLNKDKGCPCSGLHAVCKAGERNKKTRILLLANFREMLLFLEFLMDMVALRLPSLLNKSLSMYSPAKLTTKTASMRML